METESVYCEAITQSQKSLTEKQSRCLDLYKEVGSVSAVAKKLGVDVSTARESLMTAAAKLGVADYKTLRKKNNADKSEVKVNRTGAVSKRKIDAATVGEIVSLVKSQDFRCALSGVEITPENSNLDHKVPLSLGGTNDIENLQWLEAKVNRAKGNMSQDDFVLMCKRVAAWNS